MASVSVRYIVDDVDAAIEFYCGNLGFQELMHPAPAFAMLQRGDLRLVLSAPGGGPGGGQAMPDGIDAPRPVVGTASRSRSTTSRPRSTGCGHRALASATRSSTASADARSWSRTRQGTRWSCSSRPGRRRDSAPPLRPSRSRPGTRARLSWSSAHAEHPRRWALIPGIARPRRRPPAPARRSGRARRSTARRSARGRPARAGAPGSDRRGAPGGSRSSPMAPRSTGRPAASAARSFRRASWIVL